MIAQEPPPGSVIVWQIRYNPTGPAYTYAAMRVAGFGWFTTSTKWSHPLMWTDLMQRIGHAPTFVANGWAPLVHGPATTHTYFNPRS